MKQKIITIVVILMTALIVLTPISILLLLNYGNPYTKLLTGYYIPKSLDEELLLEARYIEPKHTINKDFYHRHYLVIFKDEPDVAYYYGLKKKGKAVVQFCEHDVVDEDGFTNVSKTDGKHLANDCVGIFDNRN